MCNFLSIYFALFSLFSNSANGLILYVNNILSIDSFMLFFLLLTIYTYKYHYLYKQRFSFFKSNKNSNSDSNKSMAFFTSLKSHISTELCI